MNFNQELCVQESVNKHIVNAASELTMRAIEACAVYYNFDAEEAKCMLGLSSLRVVEGKSKKSESKKPESKKVEKESKKVYKSLCPLPFNGERADECCDGLRFNNGLYTQCKTEKNGSNLCKTCQSSADKNNGVPEYGTIQQRMAVGIFEYVDPSGRKPISFLKVIKKLKVTEEQVMEEARRLNIVLNEQHLKVEEKPEKMKKVVEEEPKKLKKGRPKKSKKEVELNEECDDIFATLVANAASEEVVEDEASKEAEKAAKKESERLEKEAKKEADKAAKKEQERLEKEAKKEQERQEKEAKKEQERLEKEAKKEAEKAAKEQERQNKEAEKAAKEAAKEAEKVSKEQERLKKEAEKAAKEAAKKPAKKAAAKKTSGKTTPVLEEEEEVQEVVKKITFEGKKYLVSKNSGVVYDFEKYTTSGDQVAVGMWVESKNKIEFKSADEEESEDEYEM